MKTTKLILGIISIVLFFMVSLQSCAAGLGNALSENGEASGSAGLLLAFCMLIAGIVGLATRNSEKNGGPFTAGFFYILGGMLAFANKGTYSDLGIWSVLAIAFGMVFIIGTILSKKKEIDSDEGMEKDSLNKNKSTIVIIVIVVIVVIAIAFANNPDDVKETDSVENEEVSKVEGKESTKSDNSKPTHEDTNKETTTEAPEETFFKVGDTLEYKDIKITLNDVHESYGLEYFGPDDNEVFIVFDFEFENNSDKDLNISSYYFNAYADGYQIEEYFFMDGIGETSLTGDASPGKKIRGSIAYSAPIDYKEIEVEYEPSFWNFDNKKIVFRHTK